MYHRYYVYNITLRMFLTALRVPLVCYETHTGGLNPCLFKTFSPLHFLLTYEHID